jgi:hypothetical protein
MASIRLIGENSTTPLVGLRRSGSWHLAEKSATWTLAGYSATCKDDVDRLNEHIALIWSDRVNSAKSVGVFIVALAFSRGQSEQQLGQVERRLISLIFAGRNRIIMIRRELPLTVIASPAEPVA